MENNVYKIRMGAADCAVDLGDGSERGEYVDQDYILNRLGRPHRAISLMYCYYPLDKEWPERISVACKDKKVGFAWDYPYDDYFTYKGGINGDLSDEPFRYMREIRAHGQDVILTLTIDPNVPDEHLVAIAKDLSTFGRMMIRINHEATGNWFSFTKRATYQEIADFYVKFHNILKEYAPNVSTILCAGGVEDPGKNEIEMEKEFADAVRATDIWSVDKYMALHWGWPYDIAEKGGNSHSRSAVSDVYEMAKRSRNRFVELCGGKEKPMVLSELNSDGDVTGAYEQAEMVKLFCDRLREDPDKWLSAFTLYQFRDRGRLGLEIEDPNNVNVGIEQPLMRTYKEIINDSFFMPKMKIDGNAELPVKLRWGGSEDAEGLAIPLNFEKNPVFCEVTFEEELNLMLEINGRWFYKSPKVKTIDLMSAFFDKPLTEGKGLTLKIFAPPASGENDPADGDDWRINSYTTITKLPDIRIRYEATEPSKDR
ncbi:MAG: hypothetical protein IK990_08105 [Ruminiclostridium sp.]|nr:hypothetical protein [Ruminiclostridium sp.]